MYGDFCKSYEKDQMDICRLIHDYAEKAYKAGFKDGLEKSQAEERHKAFSEGYYCGLDDAWKCAKQISDMTMEKCEEVFGEYRYFATVVENFTATEALAKLEGYKAIHTDKGCESCKYEDEPEFTSPCVDCSRNHKDMWEAKR